MGPSSIHADIVQPKSNGAGILFGFGHYPVFGQSFTATPSVATTKTVSILWSGVYFQPPLPDPTLTAAIYQGQGYDGTLLGISAPVTVINSISDRSWIDFNFTSSVELLPGDIYSIRFSREELSGNEAGGVWIYQPLLPNWHDTSVSDSVGGYMLDGAGLPTYIDFGAEAFADLAFRVIGAPVPEPPTLELIGSAVLLFAATNSALAVRKRSFASSKS